MAKKQGSAEIEDKEKKKPSEDQGMNHAHSSGRAKTGTTRVPMYGGPKMAPGNKRVPTKKPY